MALDWLIRDNEVKDHQLFGDEHFGTEPPCTVYEKKPLVNPDTGEEVKGLYTAWVTLNNPVQYNSYTTQMIKGVIAGMHKASMDREVMAIVFTAAGDRAFCTGGNTKEYAEYYTKRPLEYAQYMDRQAGTRHGSTPTGGSTDFLPWNLSMEQAMWQATANEMWSAYKMERLGLITKAIPIKKNEKGEWVRDPRVITDEYVKDGEIVYGEYKKGAEYKKANEELKGLKTDWSLLDGFINRMVWTLTNTTFLCLMNTIESIRVKKRFFWDLLKSTQIYWLAANMNAEAFLGFNAFNTQKLTGHREIDFIKYRQLLAQVRTFDDELAEEVFYKPQK